MPFYYLKTDYECRDVESGGDWSRLVVHAFGYSEESARRWNPGVPGHKEAAERYLETNFSAFDYPDMALIDVRRVGEEEFRRIAVCVETVPQFVGHEIQEPVECPDCGRARYDVDWVLDTPHYVCHHCRLQQAKEPAP